MKRSTLISSVAACICLGFSFPLLAAEPPAAGTATQPASNAKKVSAKPAEKCLSDLRAFDNQMEKDGFWPPNQQGSACHGSNKHPRRRICKRDEPAGASSQSSRAWTAAPATSKAGLLEMVCPGAFTGSRSGSLLNCRRNLSRLAALVTAELA
jgi:hypothetical protein